MIVTQLLPFQFFTQVSPQEGVVVEVVEVEEVELAQ